MLARIPGRSPEGPRAGDRLRWGRVGPARLGSALRARLPDGQVREGIGVVVEGTWDGTTFTSDNMIIKHDEQYRTEDGGIYTPDDRYP